MTKQTRNLLILFLTIFIIKASISFFMSGTYFYSDEACVVIKAKHFADTLQMLPCKDIAQAPANDPMPLYSIIIAPFFFFFKGFSAYQAVLVFNSLAISSLVFPLYWISKNFIKKDWTAYLIITVTLFLPQITVYEKMLLTESFFVFLNIWLLYFYGKYKTEKKDTRKFLLLTILFTIMAGLERPFGFITTLAIMINELITSKNKTKRIIIFFPIFLILTVLAFIIIGNFDQIIVNLFNTITDTDKFKLLLEALKNQNNSIIVTTLFVPIIIFCNNIKQKNNKFFNSIQYFLISIILINFLISSNHIFGYFTINKNTDFITRYINISAIFLNFFALLLLNKKNDKNLSKLTIFITIFCFITLFLLKSNSIKHSLNLDLSIFYNFKENNIDNLISQNWIMKNLFFPTIILLFSFYIFGKKKILFSTISIIFISWGISIYFWNIGFSKEQNNSFEKQFFRKENSNILVLEPDGVRLVSFFVWDIMTLTKNNIKLQYLDHYLSKHDTIDFYTTKNKHKTSNFEFIVSIAPLKLPILYTSDTITIYYAPSTELNYEAHIQKLKENKKYYLEAKENQNFTNTNDLTPQENDKEQS